MDYISFHQYYGNQANNSADFLGRSVHMDSFIKSVVAICDAVKAKKHHKKTINLSFDEWNVWYHSNGTVVDDWQKAPPILEDIYNFEDALLVGMMLMTLQNNCDRVKIACLAQLVNVIAPIMTEENGPAWAQTIFYPYMFASLNGNGTVLNAIKECDSYVTTDKLNVPYLETSVIHNAENGEIVVFAVNRSLEEEMELSLSFEGFDSAKLISHTEIFADDLKIVNTKDQQNVYPVEREIVEDAEVVLKKHSWNMLKFACGDKK